MSKKNIIYALGYIVYNFNKFMLLQSESSDTTSGADDASEKDLQISSSSVSLDEELNEEFKKSLLIFFK